jgi:hypothetical protein
MTLIILHLSDIHIQSNEDTVPTDGLSEFNRITSSELRCS